MTISASQSSFAANEPVLIEFTLSNNNPKRSARILDWDIPCDDDDGLSSSSEDSVTEMSFFKIATSGGHLAKYLGALLKRAAPSEGNYKRLKPGDEVSCTIDLGQFFEFKSSDGDDNYIIKYSVTSMELFKPTSVNTTNTLEMLESNTLKIKIGDRVSPFQRNLRERSLQTLNSFSSCTTAQQTSIIEARSHAITASNNAVAIIESVGVSQSTSACPRYKEWFGPYDSSRHTELVNGYRTSRERLTFASIKFDCGCNQE